MSQQEQSREVQEIWALFRETDKRMKETDKMLKELSKKVEDTGKQVERTSEAVNALTGKWGKFVEGLVAPGAVRMFKERGIEVEQTYTRSISKKNGEEMEVDIIAANDEYVVAISVKSTLKVENVNEHIEALSKFREFFTNFSGKQLIGAVAGIVIEEEADRYAYRRGLFIITQSGEGVKILNDEKFRPKVW